MKIIQINELLIQEDFMRTSVSNKLTSTSLSKLNLASISNISWPSGVEANISMALTSTSLSKINPVTIYIIRLPSGVEANISMALTSTSLSKLTLASISNIRLPRLRSANILKTLTKNSSLNCRNFPTFAIHMKVYKALPLFVVLSLLFFTIGCTTNPDLTGVPEVSFKNDVQRILSANCNFEGCHGDQGHHEGSLVGYENVMSFGEIKAGNAHGSKLYRLITGRSGPKMPPAGYNEVSSTDIKTLYIWIEQGAKNN